MIWVLLKLCAGWPMSIHLPSYLPVWMRACVHACVRACVRARTLSPDARTHACMHAHTFDVVDVGEVCLDVCLALRRQLTLLPSPAPMNSCADHHSP